MFVFLSVTSTKIATHDIFDVRNWKHFPRGKNSIESAVSSVLCWHPIKYDKRVKQGTSSHCQGISLHTYETFIKSVCSFLFATTQLTDVTYLNLTWLDLTKRVSMWSQPCSYRHHPTLSLIRHLPLPPFPFSPLFSLSPLSSPFFPILPFHLFFPFFSFSFFFPFNFFSPFSSL